jgi:hypothetical protein
LAVSVAVAFTTMGAMRVFRIALGAAILLCVAGAALAGVIVLRETEGGGLPFSVEFADTKTLTPGDRVVYGDQVVGRVETVTGGRDVRARIASQHAPLLREGSRFWIERRLGGALLLFDNPAGAGPIAQPGARLVGLSARPEPDVTALGPPATRRLPALPAWLCRVRVVGTLPVGDGFTEPFTREATGFVVDTDAERDWARVVAPAWVTDRTSEMLTLLIRVDLFGGEPFSAELTAVADGLALLRVPGGGRAPAAQIVPQPPQPGESLLLVDHRGEAFLSQFAPEGLAFRGQLAEGRLALSDGTIVAGFAIPGIRGRGADWIGLEGLAYLTN